jgi:hypothetical protein
MGYSPWTPDDKKKVVDEIHRLVNEWCIPVPFEPGKLLALVRQAQQTVLLSTQQRSITQTKPYMWIEDEILERMTAPVVRPAGIDLTTKLVVSEKALMQEIKSTSAMWEMIRTEIHKTPVIRTLVESIAESIVDRIEADVKARLLGKGFVIEPATPAKPEPVVPIQVISLGQIKDQKPSKAPPTPSALPGDELTGSDKRRRRVVLIGLLGGHFRKIQEEYCEVFDVHLVEVDEPKRIGLCKNADMTFAMIKFINHTIEAKIRAETSNYTRVCNGMSDLRRKLDEFAKTAKV